MEGRLWDLTGETRNSGMFEHMQGTRGPVLGLCQCYLTSQKPLAHETCCSSAMWSCLDQLTTVFLELLNRSGVGKKQVPSPTEHICSLLKMFRVGRWERRSEKGRMNMCRVQLLLSSFSGPSVHSTNIHCSPTWCPVPCTYYVRHWKC